MTIFPRFSSKATFATAILVTFLITGVAAQDAQKGASSKSGIQEPFGEEVTLPARTLLMRKAKTSWDEAWANIVSTFKAVRVDADKLQLKVTGAPLIIYRSTSDDSFEFDAALPIEAAPKEALVGELSVGPARTGKAIKFIYKGPFDAMDSTYELISNYIDSKKIEAEDLSIEEYVTDPLTTKPEEIVINIFMPLKK
jgi:effector-binding domain-containing protein